MGKGGSQVRVVDAGAVIYPERRRTRPDEPSMF